MDKESFNKPWMIAHLDLKGIQFQPEALDDYLESLVQLSYQALIVEYDDVFPFSKENGYTFVPGEVWSDERLEHFLDQAKRLGLEIIPLQQTLGHLEYFFRWERYRHYCLPSGYPSTLHVGSSEAKTWLYGLLEEIITRHPCSRYVHLGMDEAYALNDYAKEIKQDPLALFLEHLDALCQICERHGRMPIIWSDMLEDHIRPESIDAIKAFRDRVILIHWDYSASPALPPKQNVRFAGWRCSRRWLNEPCASEAPRVAVGLQWFEDWPAEIQSLIEPYRQGDHMEPLFPAAVWKKMGFRVIGGTAANISGDGSVLNFYRDRMANIRTWRDAVGKWNLDGLAVTAWARTSSCGTPNLIPDLNWPLLDFASRPEDGEFSRFFPALRTKELDLLIEKIGRFREDWPIGPWLLAETAEIDPGAHHEEWKTLRLMLELHSVLPGVDAICIGVERRSRIGRIMSWEWHKNSRDIARRIEEIQELRGRTIEHLARRYEGGALQEWVSLAFDLPIEKLAHAQSLATQEAIKAEKRFSNL